MIFFLHIPKTGGQTLATRIAAAFPRGRSHLLKNNISTREELEHLCAEHDFVEGHPAADVLGNPPAGVEIISAVRNPTEQIISHYRHIRREPSLRLHVAANALAPIAFFERFSSAMFNFQTRTLVKAFCDLKPMALIHGEESWMMQNFESVIQRHRWLVPTESIDMFGPIWAMERNMALPLPAVQVNEAAADSIDAQFLRKWLQDRPERFAMDSLLWNRARSVFNSWSYEVLSNRHDAPLSGSPMCAASSGGEGIWLGTGWHPPAQRGDGITEWWSGPGMLSSIRVRRNSQQHLYFEVVASLGVHMERIRILHPASEKTLPHALETCPESNVTKIQVDLSGLGDDERLVLYGPESIQVLPNIPIAMAVPRRGYATQNWQLI